MATGFNYNINWVLVTIKFYLNVDHLPETNISGEFEATYLLLLVSNILIIFLKPKQELYELTEEKEQAFKRAYKQSGKAG